MTRLVTRALALLSPARRRPSSDLAASFCDGFLCVRSGGVDGFGEVTVELENRSQKPRRVEDVARLELISAAGRRMQRVRAEAPEVHREAGDGAWAAAEAEPDFDGRLSPGARARLRWRVLVGELEPGEEVRLRGRLASDGGTVLFESPPLVVGAVLGRGDVA